MSAADIIVRTFLYCGSIGVFLFALASGLHEDMHDEENEGWLSLVYVFDPRQASGYVMHVPSFVAYVVCRLFPQWDYAPSENGY